jgi:hypothetical protein
MPERHRQAAIDSIKNSIHMSSERYVNIKVTSDPFFKVANDSKSVCRQQPLCVSDGCLIVGWP